MAKESLLKTNCGNKVKSESERKIDNWLYRNGWISIYEPSLKIHKGKVIHPDWVLLPQNGITKPVIIEYWGLSVLKPNAAYWAKQVQPKYEAKRKKKELFYNNTPDYHYIGLTMPDLTDLDSILGVELDFLIIE